MKKEVRIISRRTWDRIQREAEQRIKDIPERCRRIRAHEYGDFLAREVYGRSRKKEIETEGRRFLYVTEVNIGSSRYKDYARSVDEYTYRRANDAHKKNIVFIYG